jgi:hypothetical protein
LKDKISAGMLVNIKIPAKIAQCAAKYCNGRKKFKLYKIQGMKSF